MAKPGVALFLALGLLCVGAAADAAAADEQTCTDGETCADDDDEAALLAHKVVKKHKEDTTPATTLPPATPSPAQLTYWAKEWIKLNPRFRNSYSGVFDAPRNADNPVVGFVTAYSCGVMTGNKPFYFEIGFAQPLSRQLTAAQVQANVRYFSGSYFTIPNYPIPPGHRVLAKSEGGFLQPGQGGFAVTITFWDGQTLRFNANPIRMTRVCFDAFGAFPGGFPPPPCPVTDGADGSFQGDLSFAIQLR